MARTIHEGLGSGLVSVRRVGSAADYPTVHIPQLPSADVLQLDHRVLGVHHQRLDPDHRHLAAVHAPHQLARHLGLLRRARSLGHRHLLVCLQRRHLLREARLQGLRRESHLLLLHAGHRAHDPADPDQTQDPCLDQFVAARTLLLQLECVFGSGPQEYDRLRRVLRHHHLVLHHLLPLAVQGVPADARPGRGRLPDRNPRLVLAVDRLAAAGRVVVLGVAEPLAVAVRPGADVHLDLPAAGHRGVDARRTRADHRAAEVQHQQPQGVRHHRLHLRHHPLHLQNTQQVAHEYHLDIPRTPRWP